MKRAYSTSGWGVGCLAVAAACVACSSKSNTPPAASAGAGGGATNASGAGTSGSSPSNPGAMMTAGCGAISTTAPSALHAAAAAIVLPDATNMHCAFSSCHNSNAKKAGLILDDMAADLKLLLVDKPACEAPNLKMIASGGGDAALKNSWLWQKLTVAINASGELVADPSWGMWGSCNQITSNGYGTRMPMTQLEGLPAESLAAIRNWICAGAPGK